MTVRTRNDNTTATQAPATEQPKQGGLNPMFLVVGLIASLLMLGNSYMSENNETKAAATECQARLESTYVAIDKLRSFNK